MAAREAPVLSTIASPNNHRQIENICRLFSTSFVGTLFARFPIHDTHRQMEISFQTVHAEQKLEATKRL